MTDQRTATIRDSAGHRIAALLTTPAPSVRQLAVLCHGLLSTKDSSTNKALTRLLAEQGLATLRFDFFGHGESDGPFEALTVTKASHQADAVISWAQAEGFTDIALVGSSFGGHVSLLAASHHSMLRCVVLKCPVADFPEVLNLEFGPEGMRAWQQHHHIPPIAGGNDPIPLRYDFYEDCRQHDGYDVATRIQAPTLIVHGDQDALVPVHQARRLQAALGGPTRLEIIPGADHAFSQAEHFHAMTGFIVDWVAGHLRSR